MASAPPCPFGAPWEALRLADVRAFLRTDPPERASWEAKQHATKAEIAKFVRRECCGFANRNGGYLLLGAEDSKGSGWTLSGIQVDGVKELHDWVASLLLELSPAPVFDTNEWGLSNGRRIVIIQIEPAPSPPVSFGGVVYQRHGTQTIRADGPAISRLADQGARARRKVEQATRKRVQEMAMQIFCPFAIAVGRHGDRPFALADSEPERAATKRLKEALEKRWAKRELVPLVWDPGRVRASTEHRMHPKHPVTAAGWRAGWEVNEVAQNRRAKAWWDRRSEARRTGRRQAPFKVGGGPRTGERDIWLTLVGTQAISVSAHWDVGLGSGHDIYDRYGGGAFLNAEMLLRAMLALEQDLGSGDQEPVFICLALQNPWGHEPVILVESWEHMTLKPREWRHAALAEAGRKMHLAPQARP